MTTGETERDSGADDLPAVEDVLGPCAVIGWVGGLVEPCDLAADGVDRTWALLPACPWFAPSNVARLIVAFPGGAETKITTSTEATTAATVTPTSVSQRFVRHVRLGLVRREPQSTMVDPSAFIGDDITVLLVCSVLHSKLGVLCRTQRSA
jgi:hypothetical protein